MTNNDDRHFQMYRTPPDPDRTCSLEYLHIRIEFFINLVMWRQWEFDIFACSLHIPILPRSTHRKIQSTTSERYTSSLANIATPNRL